MSYPQDYLAALEVLLDLERGYSNHPQDPGGETYCGIARNFWPQYWRNGRPDDETVQLFYWKEFWVPMRLETFMLQALRVEALEAGVNCGAVTGIKFVQKAYNLLRDASWQDLVVDGRVGPKTIRAVNRLCAHYPDAMLAAANYYQAHHYATRQNNRYAIRGWFGRRLKW